MLNSIILWAAGVMGTLRLLLIRKELYLKKGKYGEIRDVEAKQYGTVLIVYYKAYDTLDCESVPITYICFNVFTGRHEKISGRLPADKMAEAYHNWDTEISMGYSQHSLVIDAPWYSHKYITILIKFPQYIKKEESKEPVEGVRYIDDTYVYGYR